MRAERQTSRRRNERAELLARAGRGGGKEKARGTEAQLHDCACSSNSSSAFSGTLDPREQVCSTRWAARAVLVWQPSSSSLVSSASPDRSSCPPSDPSGFRSWFWRSMRSGRCLGCDGGCSGIPGTLKQPLRRQDADLGPGSRLLLAPGPGSNRQLSQLKPEPSTFRSTRSTSVCLGPARGSVLELTSAFLSSLCPSGGPA